MKKCIVMFLFVSLSSFGAFAHQVECFSTAVQKGYEFHIETETDNHWNPFHKLFVTVYKKDSSEEKEYCVLKHKNKFCKEVRYVKRGVKLVVNYSPDKKPVEGKIYPATYYDRSILKGFTFNKIECAFYE